MSDSQTEPTQEQTEPTQVTQASVQSYVLAVVRKQCECDAVAAQERIDSLSQDEVQELYIAGKNAELHTVRRILGFPVPEFQEAKQAVEIGLNETVTLPAGTFRFAHLKQHSNGIEQKPVIILVDETPPEEDTKPEDDPEDDPEE